MKVFISGPMSGIYDNNRLAFYDAEKLLEKHGYSVFNPAWLNYPNDTEFTLNEIQDIDNCALFKCDAIFMLNGWEKSYGARKELDIARKAGLKIWHQGSNGIIWYHDPSAPGWGHMIIPKNKESSNKYAVDVDTLDLKFLTYNLTKVGLTPKDISTLTGEPFDKINKMSRTFCGTTYLESINSIYDDLEEVRDEMDGIKEQLDKLNGPDWKGFEQNLDIIETKKYVNNKIDELTRDINAVNAIQDSRGARLSAVEKLLEKHRDSIDNINVAIKNTIDLQVKDRDILNKKVDAANDMIANLSERITSLHNRVSRLENEMSTNNDIIRNVNNNMSDLVEKVSYIKSQCSAHADILNQHTVNIKESFEHFTHDDDALERRIQNIEKKLGI